MAGPANQHLQSQQQPGLPSFSESSIRRQEETLSHEAPFSHKDPQQ